MKIGLNAQIVFVKKWANEYQDVIQILGTGTSQVSYKVHLWIKDLIGKIDTSIGD